MPQSQVGVDWLLGWVQGRVVVKRGVASRIVREPG